MKKVLFALLLGCVAGRAQTSVTLNGTAYTFAPHPRTLIDGPGGSIDSRIKDPDGAGPLKAPKAVASNPAWVALGTAVASHISNYQSNAQHFAYRDGSVPMQFATYWYADNSQTAAHDAALYMLNHIEYYLPLVCVESTVDCTNGGTGYGVTSYGIAYWTPNWIMAYELMRGEMTAAQRQAFASKMLNDLSTWGGVDGAAGTSCTNPTVDSGATVTISNNQWTVDGGTLTGLTVKSGLITATISGSTAGVNVGGQVTLVDGPLSLNYPILAVLGTNQFTFGYTGVPDGAYATAGATLTYQQAYATASAPVFGTSINAGDWIFTNGNNNNLGVVDTILDSTHAYLDGGMGAAAADEMYSRPMNWSAGQCGMLWHVKHDAWTAQVMTTNNGATQYPPIGGQNGGDPGHNLVYSSLWGIHLLLLSVADDDANGAARSGKELTTAYNWWFANQYATAERLWTGFHQSGSGYGLARTDQFMPGTAIAVQNSLVSAPNLMGGVWAKNLMVMKYANTFPNSQRGQMQWGQPDVSGGFGGMTAQNLDGFVMLAWWFRATQEGQYANWWLQNIWGGASGFGVQPGQSLAYNAGSINNAAPSWFFIFTDQSYPTASLSTAPTTFLFNSSDTGSTGQRADAIVSRTGYLSATDTLMNFHAESIPEFDHNVFANQPSNYGSYKIFKGHYLLAEDYGINFGDPAANGFTIGGTSSNYVEVGGTVNNVKVATPVTSGIPRASGNSSFAYAMADVTQAYLPAAALQHGYRHLVDFKKAGTQQFILDYMDFQTSTGKVKKAYYHYPNMSTTGLSAGVVTSNNSNGNPSQLLTQVMTPQPVLIAQDTSGSSFRLDVCPSLNGTTCDATNTKAEMMVVHMPAAGTSNSLPPIAMMNTIDANFRGVEIDGPSPKIAVFARNGSTYTATSFTAAHTGTAQILIAGITPTVSSGKNYTLIQNGTPVLQHQTVGADGSMYYEGTAGDYLLVAEAAPPQVAAIELPNAMQYQTYSQPLTCFGGTLPLTWTVAGGALPAGLSLDSVTGTISGIPVSSGTASFTVQVTDALGNSDSGSGSIATSAAAALSIQTLRLTGKAGFVFSEYLMATGGGGGYQWTLQSGSLPSGWTLATNGLVSGSTTSQVSGSVTVNVTDAYGNTASQSLPVAVTASPATLVTGAATILGSTVLR